MEGVLGVCPSDTSNSGPISGLARIGVPYIVWPKISWAMARWPASCHAVATGFHTRGGTMTVTPSVAALHRWQWVLLRLTVPQGLGLLELPWDALIFRIWFARCPPYPFNKFLVSPQITSFYFSGTMDHTELKKHSCDCCFCLFISPNHFQLFKNNDQTWRISLSIMPLTGFGKYCAGR